MVEQSKIEWTDATWNPVTGCTRVSPGCDNCYAARFAECWRGVPGHAYEQGFDLRLWPERLDAPLRWTRPRFIFVNSMSDLFHEDVPDAYLARVFDTMEAADHHVFQVLTKRAARMQAWLARRYGGAEASGPAASSGAVPAHIWPGVSVESAAQAGRIARLRAVASPRRFVSFEPLIGSVGAVDLAGIAWAIVGGESGPGARRMDPAWVAEIESACARHGTAFFFKRWGNPRRWTALVR